jgi:CubicO group peptidase (beta-lactamase class C family)
MRRPLRAAALVAAFVVPLSAASVVGPAAWAQALQSGRPEEVGMSSERLAKIRPAFEREIAEAKIPGAVIMVARKGRVVYSESVGAQAPSGPPMAKDAIFRIYSMTKPFTSVAAMMLVEDGRIQLTDPVSKFLPEMRTVQVSAASTNALAQAVHVAVPAERQATVQDLLRHTAGLAYGEITTNPLVKQAYVKAGLSKPDFDYNTIDLTPDAFVQGLASAPLAHQPGTVWEYGLATDVLGRVVEKASGKRLGEFLEERLFVPLRMADTAFSVRQDKQARVAEPFAKDPATGAPNRLIAPMQPPGNDSGGAGAVSTASDYLRFSQMLLNGGELDGVRVLSPTTIALMASDHLGPDIKQPAQPGELLLGAKGYTFGLGFAVRKEQGIAGVPGSPGDYTWAGYAGTVFWVDPKEELVAVLMTQAPGPSRAYYRRLVRQLVYGAITQSPGSAANGRGRS